MPKGFKAGSAFCGLKTNQDSLDMAILFSDVPCAAAALFTKNKICAAPVKLSREHLKTGKISAIVINSGNANACTGKQGAKDALTMAKITAKQAGVEIDKVLVASTGIIGHELDMDKVNAGIVNAASNMGCDLYEGSNAAKAIITTDLTIKEAAVKVETKEYSYTIGGITKGSGMISPNMATMLGFITTDAKISKATLNACLKKAVDLSFNSITVDGHTSTNDMVAIMANGANMSGSAISKKDDIALFQTALNYVTQTLAKKIVEDGEGATKFIQIDVTEAASRKDAEVIAREVANSPLVKTAINGEDANWGRIVSAAGYANAGLDEDRLKLYINDILVFNNGAPVKELSNQNVAFQKKLNKAMQKKEITLNLQLGLGTNSATMWTCDFSHGYITINAEYHT